MKVILETAPFAFLVSGPECVLDSDSLQMLKPTRYEKRPTLTLPRTKKTNCCFTFQLPVLTRNQRHERKNRFPREDGIDKVDTRCNRREFNANGIVDVKQSEQNKR